MRRRSGTGAGWSRRSGCDCSVWTRSPPQMAGPGHRAFAAGPGRAGQHAGYNVYNTQRARWLGWLDPAAGTGTYARSTSGSVSAQNRLPAHRRAPDAAVAGRGGGVDRELLQQARASAAQVQPLASQCAAIRKLIPWRTLAEVLESSLDSHRSNP